MRGAAEAGSGCPLGCEEKDSMALNAGEGSMHNVCCTVEYDGTDFFGFQRQPDRVTVQGTLEDALRGLTGVETAIYGAGRTDAGVHAAGQAFSFRTETNIPVERWPLALNSRLPRTIIVRDARLVCAGFHARKSPSTKAYSYTIDNAPLPSVFTDRYALHVRRPLDATAMNRAAAFLVGRHDFAAFRATGSSPVRTTVRHIVALEVTRHGSVIAIRAEADGFLYRMMRNIVGSLLLVGRGERPPDWLKDVLQAKDRQRAGPTAPARGLCLDAVKYC